ncbi:MAG TPA: DUF5666 domain-containing protein [Verrucomicrobiae bacterium]|nr:DUF5666 domain-containing protein [Verrucomicrobiae bacterium]
MIQRIACKGLILLAAACAGGLLTGYSALGAGAQAQGSASIARKIGTIKAIDGNKITLAPASGPEVAVTVEPNARILRLAPGEKDLKTAAPITVQDLQVGDTIRVRGYASDDARNFPALEVLVITHAAVAAMSEQIREDWQKRGMGGLVSAVDPAAGNVTVTVVGFGGTKSVVIHTSKTTIFRRYAPDSVKFEDARLSTFQDLHPGDQLRARGERNPDGTEFTAEEIVSGRFRNIAGTVDSINEAAGTVSVKDLLSKKLVRVKVTADSQMHKLPPEVAQRFAMRFKAAMHPGGQGSSAGASGESRAAPEAAGQNHTSDGGAEGRQSGMGAGMHSSGAPDLQQILNRMPAVTLNELHKGDAVMMVATEGEPSSDGTAITLLSGVEPLLEAAPNGSEAMMLAPWSLGGAPAGDANNP